MTDEEYWKPHKCPVCGKHEFPTHGSFEFCDECGWQDDYIQEEDEEASGANWDGLKGHRALYEAKMLDETFEVKAKWLEENHIYE